MNAKAYVQRFEESKAPGHIYLAGPIDMATGDPDARHRELDAVLFMLDLQDKVDVWCPFCIQSVMQSVPAQAVHRNLQALIDSVALIAVWTGPVEQPSFGTPVELFASGSANPDRTFVVGTMGSGMLADALRARGVREVDSLDRAVALLRF